MASDLFKQIRNLNLPSKSYVVFGSEPLASRGIISLSNDLDVLCDPVAWKIVSDVGVTEFLPEYDVTVVSLFDAYLHLGLSGELGISTQKV